MPPIRGGILFVADGSCDRIRIRRKGRETRPGLTSLFGKKFMKHLRIYVDASVIGGCLDDEFSTESLALMDLARQKKVTLLVSDLLMNELLDAPEKVKGLFRRLPDDCGERAEMGPETEFLCDKYIEAKVVPAASADDARHVALATIAQADMIVSWNFRHIVHFEKIRGFNAVNLREGYQTIEIRSPREVV